jgi:hypothetical protein
LNHFERFIHWRKYLNLSAREPSLGAPNASSGWAPDADNELKSCVISVRESGLQAKGVKPPQSSRGEQSEEQRRHQAPRTRRLPCN